MSSGEVDALAGMEAISHVDSIEIPECKSPKRRGSAGQSLDRLSGKHCALPCCIYIFYLLPF